MRAGMSHRIRHATQTANSLRHTTEHTSSPHRKESCVRSFIRPYICRNCRTPCFRMYSTAFSASGHARGCPAERNPIARQWEHESRRERIGIRSKIKGRRCELQSCSCRFAEAALQWSRGHFWQACARCPHLISDYARLIASAALSRG